MSTDKKDAPSLDDMRGMTADDFKKSVTGDQQQAAQSQGQEPAQQQQQQTNSQDNTESKQPTQQTTDANNNADQKDVSVLANTFGIEYESLPEEQQEGFLKMAKSYREAQGKYTSVAQKVKEAEQAAQSLQQFNQFLGQNPDLKNQIQQRLSGNQSTGEDTPSKPQPANNGKSATVDVNQLKSDGYISDEDLQGLDELAKERKVAKAELAYLRDQELSKFREGLKQEKEKLTQAERAEKVKKTNAQRLNDGVDRVVSDYGIDFTSLDNETINAIQNRALRILDPQDPTGQTIDKDAMYDATLKELSLRDKLPNRQPQMQRKSLDQITDTGRQINKSAGPVARPNTRENYYEQKMAERRANMKDSSGIFANN